MIEKYSFGKIVIDGITYTSDIKIVGGEVISEWWRRSGHIVDIDDIRDLLKGKPKYLVFGTGKPGFMKTSSQLHSHLQSLGIQLIEEPTEKAVEIFNDLVKNKEAVSAGLHLTC